MQMPRYMQPAIVPLCDVVLAHGILHLQAYGNM